VRHDGKVERGNCDRYQIQVGAEVKLGGNETIRIRARRSRAMCSRGWRC
jgi:hypothetical protein